MFPYPTVTIKKFQGEYPVKPKSKSKPKSKLTTSSQHQYHCWHGTVGTTKPKPKPQSKSKPKSKPEPKSKPKTNNKPPSDNINRYNWHGKGNVTLGK